jgi:hypothetical protein
MAGPGPVLLQIRFRSHDTRPGQTQPVAQEGMGHIPRMGACRTEASGLMALATYQVALSGPTAPNPAAREGTSKSGFRRIGASLTVRRTSGEG